MSEYPLKERLLSAEERRSEELSPLPDDGVPDNLPPFDIAGALLQLNGNSSLLRKLLLLFCDMYRTAISELRRQMAEGEVDDAQRIAHSLRGSAGTLNARELSEAASALEHAMREGRMAEVDLLINALERALNPALAAAGSLGPVAPPSHSPSSPSPQCNGGSTVADLRKCIAANNVRARKLFAQMSGTFVGFGVDAEVSEIGSRLESLDFAGALSLLDQISVRFEER